MDNYCIFILHGSRSPEARLATNQFKKQLLENLESPFTVCYLKGDSPSLSEALENAVLNGASNIVCFPLFVMPGQHICEDIPTIIDDFKKKHYNCKIKLLPSLVENQYFVEFLVRNLETNNE